MVQMFDGVATKFPAPLSMQCPLTGLLDVACAGGQLSTVYTAKAPSLRSIPSARIHYQLPLERSAEFFEWLSDQEDPEIFVFDEFYVPTDTDEHSWLHARTCGADIKLSSRHSRFSGSHRLCVTDDDVPIDRRDEIIDSSIQWTTFRLKYRGFYIDIVHCADFKSFVVIAAPVNIAHDRSTIVEKLSGLLSPGPTKLAVFCTLLTDCPSVGRFCAEELAREAHPQLTGSATPVAGLGQLPKPFIDALTSAIKFRRIGKVDGVSRDDIIEDFMTVSTPDMVKAAHRSD